MRTLLNIVWVLTSGFWLWLGYLVAGVLGCLLIVTIPFGVASFRMARYVLWPFGRAVVPKQEAGPGTTVMNVIWFIGCGWWLVLAHIASAIASALTIVGILNVVVNLKMIPVACFPFGKQIVARSQIPAGAQPLHSA